MATEFDATAYAARLGVTREAFPEWFECVNCGVPFEATSFNRKYTDHCDYCGYSKGLRCTLPSPHSDDPRACLWEPFLMRALGWRHRVVVLQNSTPAKYGTTLDAGWHDWPKEWFATPTAALAAAFDAKEAK